MADGDEVMLRRGVGRKVREGSDVVCLMVRG